MSKSSMGYTAPARIDELSDNGGWLTAIHPLPKLLLTMLFIVMTVSFDKYDLYGLMGMAVYLISVYIVGELSVKDAVYRMRAVLPLVCIAGIVNPFFDRTVIAYIGGIAVTGGVISMVTLIIKGVFTVLAVYSLIASTSIEALCGALRILHVPKMIVTVIMLIYRYIFILTEEVHTMMQAYSMRSYGQKGVQFKAWGTFAGQLLLKSMDRAQDIYESMLMRGYDGEYHHSGAGRLGSKDYAYMFFWISVMLIFRFFPVMTLAGSLLV